VTRLNENLLVRGSGSDATVVCRCGQEIGPITENYKLRVLMREGPVQNAGPWVDPNGIGGDRFVCREFFCPGCLRLLDVEIAQRHEPVLWDVRLAT
jgi:N-methylhydantoinase B